MRSARRREEVTGHEISQARRRRHRPRARACRLRCRGRRRAPAARRATIRGIPPFKFKPNRYIQDGLRWDKDVYTVKSGGTLHVVNDDGSEGPHTFTVVAKKDVPKTAKQVFNCKICNKLAKAHGADPNSDAPPKFPFLENGVGQHTPPNVDRPGDSGLHRPGQEGRRRQPQGHGEEGHDALLHLPDPPVDAGEGRGQVARPCGRERSRGPWRSAGALALSAASPARGARTLRLLGRGRPDLVEHRPQRPRRDHGHAGQPGDSIFPTVVYRRYSPHWRKPLPNAAHSNADGLLIPGPLIHARVGDRLRIHFKNLDTLRHAPHSMHFHGVHYRPSSDGAYVPGFSGRDADVKYGHTCTYRPARRRRLGRASGPTTTTRRRWITRSPAACSGCSRSSAATSARPTASSRSFLAVRQGLHGDRRPRLRRQHARLPLEGRRPRPVGRDGDGLRPPHLPRPRPPLDRTRRHPARHADGRAGRELPDPLARARPRARGSTTATSRTT